MLTVPTQHAAQLSRLSRCCKWVQTHCQSAEKASGTFTIRASVRYSACAVGGAYAI